MAVGLGIYLPVYINMAIAVGSILGWLIERHTQHIKLPCEQHQQVQTLVNRKGILIASGFIVGESLVGVFLAIIILISLSLGYSDAPFAIDGLLTPLFGEHLAAIKNILSLIVFIVICTLFYKRTIKD